MILVNEGSYQINVCVRDTVLLLDSSGVAILVTYVDLTTLFLNRTISLINIVFKVAEPSSDSKCQQGLKGLSCSL